MRQAKRKAYLSIYEGGWLFRLSDPLVNRASDDEGHAANNRYGNERAGGQVPNLNFRALVHEDLPPIGLSRQDLNLRRPAEFFRIGQFTHFTHDNLLIPKCCRDVSNSNVTWVNQV